MVDSIIQLTSMHRFFFVSLKFSGCDSRAQSLHPFLSQTPSNQRRAGGLDQNWQGDLFDANLFPGPLFQKLAVEGAVQLYIQIQQKCQMSFCILYMLWLNFILGLNYTFLSFKLIIIYYDTQKPKKRKVKPRIN